MLQINKTSRLTAIRNRHPACGGKVAKDDRFDLVLRAAQALFAQDIWVSKKFIAKELNMTPMIICYWAAAKGSQISFLISQYQVLQQSLGIKNPSGQHSTGS